MRRTQEMIERIRRACVWGLAFAAAALGLHGPAAAQEWPSKTIRIVAPSAPGGVTDLIARILAERLTPALKVAVVVENRTGGTGAVALDALAKSAPDGYTLGIGFTGANIILPLLNDKLPFNAQRAFTPIGQVSSGGNVLMVHPSVPVSNLKEFIAYVKAQPKPPSYGSWGNGSGGHLAGEYLKILTGIDMVHVPYRTTTALTTDMIGGHMPLGFLDAFNALTQLRAGKLKPIAQTGPMRASTMAEVPTMLEEGVPFGVGIWMGVFGPANLPRPIVARLNAEIARILRAPDLQERWLTTLATQPSPTTPEEFERIVQEDWQVWKRVIAQGKITLD